MLALAAIAIIVTTTLNGGAKSVSYDEFAGYVENSRYYHPEGEQSSLVYYDDEEGQRQVAEGYTFVNGQIMDGDQALIQIVKVEFNQYQLKG